MTGWLAKWIDCLMNGWLYVLLLSWQYGNLAG
jgi:hypothetical protein